MTFRIAVVQPISHPPAEAERNLPEALRTIERAAQEGAHFVCFPETYPGPWRMPATFDTSGSTIDPRKTDQIVEFVRLKWKLERCAICAGEDFAIFAQITLRFLDEDNVNMVEGKNLRFANDITKLRIGDTTRLYLTLPDEGVLNKTKKCEAVNKRDKGKIIRTDHSKACAKPKLLVTLGLSGSDYLNTECPFFFHGWNSS